MARGKVKNAKRYARMLFNATGADRAGKVIEELTVLDRLIEESREVKNFFLSPMVGDEERKKGIDAIRDRMGLSDEVVKFLHFLSDRRAVDTLPEILRHFVTIYYEKRKRAKAVVVTPLRFNGEFEQRIVRSLEKLTGREIELQYEVDPELIGGLVVKIGSSMYDASIKGQLTRLREQLARRF